MSSKKITEAPAAVDIADGDLIGQYNVATGLWNKLTGLLLKNKIQAAEDAAKAYADGLVADPMFNPGDISGLTLWIDAQQPLYTASYAAQCSANGDQIGVVPDCSGAGVTLTVSATKPTFSPAGLNGHPCINFGGTSYLTANTFFTAAYDTAMTIFVVSESTDTFGGQVVVATTGTTNFWFDLNTSTKQFGYTAAGLSGNGTTYYLGDNGVHMFRYDGAAVLYGRHGVFLAGGINSTCYAKSLARTGNLGLDGQTLGIAALPAGSSKFQGKMGEVLVYKAALTDDQCEQVMAYLAKKWSLNKTLVVCGGDSITSGAGSTGGATQALSTTGSNYPGQLWGLLGSSAYDVRVDAYPGRIITQMLPESPLFVDTLQSQYAGDRIYIMLGGTNTLQTYRSAGLFIQQYTRFCRDRRAEGYRVIAGTLINRADDGLYAGWGNDRSVVNEYIRDNWQDFADGVADFGAAAALADPTNTTYFDADKLHLKDAGYAVIAATANAAILALP